MLDLVLLFGVARGIVWIVWKMRTSDEAAWCMLLDDPNYSDRRHLEERKRVVDEARKHHGEALAL
jgi:CBS domain-containing protein